MNIMTINMNHIVKTSNLGPIKLCVTVYVFIGVCMCKLPAKIINILVPT